MTLKNDNQKWPWCLHIFDIKVLGIHIFCNIDIYTYHSRLQMTEVSNYFPFYTQKYIKTIYFWNQCVKSYHMRPDVTFTSPELADYLPYCTQNYIETIYLSNQYKETYNLNPIFTLSKPELNSFQKLWCGKTFNCSLNNWFLIFFLLPYFVSQYVA